MFTDLDKLGVIYDDPTKAAANTAAIRNYMAANTGDLALAITGPKDNDGNRHPGVVYLQGDTQSIFSGADRNFSLVGLGASKFEVSGAAAGNETVPLFSFVNSSSAYTIMLRDFRIETTQSGIQLSTVGTQARLDSITIEGTGTTGNALYDSFDDIDFTDDILPVPSCSYGIWVNDSDGTTVEDVRILNAGDVGLLATRWHDGRCHIGQVQGGTTKTVCGIKGERINGTEMDIRAESCLGYGAYLERCGTNFLRGTSRTYSGRPAGGTTRISLWTENNNKRGNTIGATLNRQSRFSECRGLQVYNKPEFSNAFIHANPSVRQLNEFKEALYLAQSGSLQLDLNDLSDLNSAFDNFATAWPSGNAPTPILESDGSGGQQLRFQFGSGSYDDAAADAYYRPWGNSPFTAAPGEAITQSLTIRVDQALVDMCAANEPEGESTSYDAAVLGGAQLNQLNNGVPTNQEWTGQYMFAFWDLSSRKIYCSIFKQGGVGAVIPHVYVFLTAMGLPLGSNPLSTGNLIITDWAVYKTSNL